MSDSNMQYVTSTSFLLLTYAKYLTSARTVVNCGGTVVTPKRLRTIAKKQVHQMGHRHHKSILEAILISYIKVLIYFVK